MPPLAAEQLLNQPSFQQFQKAVAERKLPLVCLCGAGLSAQAGLPRWQDLRKKLEKHASEKVASLNQLGQKYYDSKLRAAESNKDPWVAFQLIEDILSEPTFRNYIIEYLTPAPGTSIPSAYEHLMRLQPRGLVTLNLDKFSGEAMASWRPGHITTPIHGLELARKWNALQYSDQYLVYLHGELSDPSNWILTRNSLSHLLKSKAHEHFLIELYTRHVVLFVGVSVDDIALSSRLLELAAEGIKPPALYWLTTRIDHSTEKWASKNGIALMMYQAANASEHTEIIKNLVDACTAFLPKEEEKPTPVQIHRSFSVSSAPDDPKKLAQQDPETIRKVLSNRLQRQLSNCPSDSTYEEFDKFCKKYRYPLNRAFFKDDDPEFSKWFDLQLHFPSLGKGNFGEVFHAFRADASSVAVKIMHEPIVSDANMLGGFRRGVRAMRFLTEAKVAGVVPIIDAYELPPTVIMDYVEGVTLDEAISSRPNLPWSIKLAMGSSIAKVVLAGHTLPRTIMHRDLKPSNIMITNFEHTGLFNPTVVVLDFDMSWHKGSSEKDVVFESRDDFGYLAPEQTTMVRGVSAVSTRVDSYGLGMTLYFLFGGLHPRSNEGLSEQWLGLASRATARDYDEKWKSLPTRLARLIRDCTQIAQSDRLDFALASKEIDAIQTVVIAPEELDNPDIFAEEIMARLPLPTSYEWASGSAGGRARLARGLEVVLQPDFRNAQVAFQMAYVDQGLQSYGDLGWRLEGALDKSVRALEKTGWKVLERRKGNGQLFLRAAIGIEECQSDFGNVNAGASDAYQAVEAVLPH